jgi:hypothetical protein
VRTYNQKEREDYLNVALEGAVKLSVNQSEAATVAANQPATSAISVIKIIGFSRFSFAIISLAGVAATRACERNEVERTSKVGRGFAQDRSNLKTLDLYIP